ncbi:hypothetical protein Lfu02_30270 [Longispora fulva]|uniref:Uncharacterized protein n=1 Tax=Longispora fulva TaxID=619741 RepID=A0A8J7GLU0_9ACTN|nr:hypothetical protein [Longispora fulva]MBG6139163.1 hypothetical protein [Longispora fulva]GIG58655.1 hypothetical protein Lfu02_30270 [Longispora fulva]
MAALETYGRTSDEPARHGGSGHPATIYGIAGVLVEHDGMTYRQWLVPGLRYEIRPNDGWKLVDADGILIGHLVEEDGSAIRELPTADGPLVLVRPNSYSVQEVREGAWEVLVLEPAL